LAYGLVGADPFIPPCQNTLPASGPVIHFQTPSIAASLAPNHTHQLVDGLRLDGKPFSSADVIVAKYLVALLKARLAAAFLA
jgi:hypothetical protein